MTRTQQELIKALRFREGMGQCWLATDASLGGGALIVPTLLKRHELLRVFRRTTIQAALTAGLITLSRPWESEPMPDFVGHGRAPWCHFTHGLRIGLPKGDDQ